MAQDSTDTSLLERESELEAFGRAVDSALGGQGGLVLVEGPAGIGKTRLLEAARARAESAGLRPLRARASELDRDFPFGVVRQLFEPVLASSGSERRAEMLQGAAAAAGPLLAGGAFEQDPALPGVDAALPHFHALYWLTVNLAEEEPLALVVDDAHWADITSLRFVQFILPRLDELPVLLMLAARPPDASAGGQALAAVSTDPAARTLRPVPLSGEAVRTLIASELHDDPDARFTAACREATGGNPFLLLELLRELARERVAPVGAGVQLVRQLAPPTVARAVLLRLARLGPDAAALAHAVAVVGDDSPMRIAAALAKLSDDAATEAAASLARADIFATAPRPGFAHPILRAAVYGDLDPAARSELHRRAAELLEAEGASADALAVHLLPTQPAGDPRSVETLRAAAGSALTRGALQTAVDCLRRALEEPPAQGDRSALVLELASAELRAGETSSAAEHFAEGLRTTGDTAVRIRYAHEQATAFFALERREEAFAILEREVEEAAGTELALLAEAHLLASANFEGSRLTFARERMERHRGKLAGATPGERMLLATGAHLDTFYGDAPADQVADAAERALRDGALFDDTAGTSPTFYQAIDVLLLADRVEPARRALEKAFEYARRRGSAPVFAFASGWRCWLLAREGALQDAEADGRACAELALPQGWFAAVPLLLGNLIDVLVDRGETGDARAYLDKSGMGTRRAGDFRAFFTLLGARMRLRAVEGDLAGAQGDASELARVGRDARWTTYPAFLPPVLTAPALAPADSEEARAQAAETLRQAQSWGTPRAIGIALHAAALVESGERQIELLAEATTALESSPAKLEQARALGDLGAALRRSNRRADAREPLRQALDLADACGARPLAERTRQELRAAGGRPRRPRVSGVDALTASERRITELAVEGLSNPEIAQTLFVTKKTVEAHLSNAYRKLDIESRAQLAEALRGDRRAGAAA